MKPRYREVLAEIKKNFRSNAQEEFAAMFDTNSLALQAEVLALAISPGAPCLTKKIMIDLATNWFDANQRFIGEGSTMEDYYNSEIKGRHKRWVKQVLREHKEYSLGLEESVVAWGEFERSLM